MSSTAALVLLLSLASQSFGAPVAAPYDDGQYHPSGNDGDYTWAPATQVAAPSSVAPVSSVVPVPTGYGKPPVSSSNATAPTVTLSSTASGPASATKSGGVFATVKPSTSVAASASASKSSAAAPSSTGTTGGSGKITQGRGPPLSGDGSKAAGWPETSDWLDFETLWSANEGNIAKSCDGAVQNSARETSDIKAGIPAIAKKGGVDERFVLAVMLQESHGCVRVGATANGVTNPGIMQDHNGKFNCIGKAADQCTTDDINGMLSDGVTGTAYVGADGGSGLQQTFGEAASKGGKTDAQKYYIAARLYNSGDNSYTAGQDLAGAAGATGSYVGDIAQRLTGYVF